MFTKIRFHLHIHVLVYPFYLAHLKRPNDPAWSSTVKWRINFGPVIEILLSIIFKSCGSNFVLFIGLVQSGPHHLLIENLFACSRHDIAEKLQLNNNHSLVSVFEFCHAYPSLKVNFTHSDTDRFSFPKCILLPGYSMPRITIGKPRVSPLLSLNTSAQS